MKLLLLVLAALLAANHSSGAAAADAAACDAQVIALSWNGQPVTRWVAEEDAIKRVELPNGFPLGIMIGPDLEDRAGPFVKITLYALDGPEPRKLTSTFGGKNSRQGYGARGGADRVVELGDPGISMTLSRSECRTGGGAAAAGIAATSPQF